MRSRWSAVAVAAAGVCPSLGTGMRGAQCSPYRVEGFLDSGTRLEESVEVDGCQDPKMPRSDTYQRELAISFKGPSSCPAEQGERGAVEERHPAAGPRLLGRTATRWSRGPRRGGHRGRGGNHRRDRRGAGRRRPGGRPPPGGDPGHRQGPPAPARAGPGRRRRRQPPCRRAGPRGVVAAGRDALRRTSFGTPFFARRWEPSTPARDQSSSPTACSSARRAGRA